MPIPRCLHQGAYCRVCFAQGDTTKRGQPIQDTHEGPTPRCPLESARPKATYSELPTPSCLLRGAHFGPLKPRLATLRSLQLGTPRLASRLMTRAQSQIVPQRKASGQIHLMTIQLSVLSCRHFPGRSFCTGFLGVSHSTSRSGRLMMSGPTHLCF